MKEEIMNYLNSNAAVLSICGFGFYMAFCCLKTMVKNLIIPKVVNAEMRKRSVTDLLVDFRSAFSSLVFRMLLSFLFASYFT